jgi:hypothetical protein
MASPTYLGSQHGPFVPVKPSPVRAAVQKDWRTPLLAAGAVALLAIPAVALLVWPKAAPVAAFDRGVMISGPVMGFEQTAAGVAVRIGAGTPGERRELVVRGSGADARETIVPLGDGEARLAVALPQGLARTSSIEIIVRPRPASGAAAR